MRAVIQRVASASVDVEGRRVSDIGPGLLVFLGVGQSDGPAEVAWMVEKVAHLRIFEDEAGKMNKSLLDGTRALLAVSQFTLYADTRKGRRPSFIAAREPGEAKRLYLEFCAQARAAGLHVGEGIFGADMKVALLNDGPVTLLLDTAG